MKERTVQILKQERGELRADQKEEAKQLSSLLIFVSSLPDDSFKDLDIDDKFPGPSVMAWAENKQQQSAGRLVTCTPQGSAGSKPLMTPSPSTSACKQGKCSNSCALPVSSAAAAPGLPCVRWMHPRMYT